MSTSGLIGVVVRLVVVASMLLGGRPVIADDERTAGFVLHPQEASHRLHSIELEGQQLRYLTTAGTITLFDEGSAEATAKVFFTAYRVYESVKPRGTLDAMAGVMLSEEERSRVEMVASTKGEPAGTEALVGALLAVGASAGDVLEMPEPEERPISFSFNGGPGSSSVWLHLGIFGPKRIAYADVMGNPGPPPYRLVTNESTLLGETDWVFIDPVSTGYSRTEGDTPGSAFHGVEQDIASVGEFIRRYLTTEQRWASAKFIAGESYGTTRAAGLADHLHDRHGINLNGVILVSTVLDFGSIRFNVGHDLPYILFLPSYTATAHHHGKLNERYQAMSMDQVLEEAEAFAIGQYATALMKGTSLPATEMDAVAARMAELTGLSEEYVKRASLRVDQERFSKELLRDEGGQTVGRFDSRFTGIDRDDAGERYSYDPSYSAIRSIYTQTFNDYVRRDLGYESDLSYEILTGRVHPWDYGSAGNNRFVNTADRLRDVMQQQPSMKVFVANGRFDLATPYFGTEYVIDHMMLRENVRGNVEQFDYNAGHMMYLNEPDLVKLGDDLKAWYREVLGD